VNSLKKMGYSIKESCEALNVPRSSYYASLQRNPTPERAEEHENARGNDSSVEDDELLQKIRAIKSDHPFWGYRRVTAYLRHRRGIKVNHKKVYMLMKKYSLTVSKETKKRAKRPLRPKPKAERPKEYWGTASTKFMINSVGWAYLVVVLDWFTKKIVGWELSLRSRSAEWKKALDMALNDEFTDGVRGSGLKLISDNGSQPTSCSFINDMKILGIDQRYLHPTTIPRVTPIPKGS